MQCAYDVLLLLFSFIEVHDDFEDYYNNDAKKKGLFFCIRLYRVIATIP